MTWEVIVPLQFGTALRDDPTEAELLESCKRGELQAFERLYKLHAARLKSLAFHLLGSRDDAEDAVQEMFLKVYRAVGNFESNSTVSTWMLRILINCCYDILRKRQRLAEKPMLKEVSAESKVTLKVALERALLSLNEQHRLVFLMFEVEGLKHSEISSVSGGPRGDFRAWLFERQNVH